ncbi:MAG: hypothetical protein WBA88_23950 [Pseudaminobacter sp.]
MSISVSAGKDPATVSVRQYCMDGSYDYMETVIGPMKLAMLIGDLMNEWVRVQQHLQWQERQKAKAHPNTAP